MSISEIEAEISPEIVNGQGDEHDLFTEVPNGSREPDQVSEALRDLKMGFHSVPVPDGKKGPRIFKWNDLRLDETAIRREIRPGGNRALLLGSASGGLIDIDIDYKQATRLARWFLPPTDRRHGRLSKPNSHWWYRVNSIDGEVADVRTEVFKGTDGKPLVELRGDRHATLVPTSIHPSGERLVWHSIGKPAEVTLPELRRAVSQMAAAALVLQRWGQGSRHELAMALSGALLRGGIDIKEVKHFITAVCHAARDEELADRLSCADTTLTRLQNGEETTGQPKLAELLGEHGQEIVEKLSDWLELESTEYAAEQPPGNAPPHTPKQKCNPTAVARDYLADLRTSAKLPDNKLVLAFWGGTFYRFDVRLNCWKPLLAAEMFACVMRFRQDKGRNGGVTSSQIRNVIANLEGLTILDCGDEAAPFYVEQSGPHTKIDRRNYVVFKNGMLNIDKIEKNDDSAELIPPDPNYFNLFALPYEYDAGAGCENFQRFLRHVLEIDPETDEPIHRGDRRREVLQEFFGYCLLPDARFHKFLLMVGEGANGKSVVQRLLTKMLGENNVSHIELGQFKAEFALQPLLGKAANICGDLDQLQSLEEGVLKRLTGEDNLTVNRKGLPHVTMQPNMKFVFACNSLPRFRDRSNGLWRRLIAMPFNVTIKSEEQDAMLATKLEAELPGILNWAITGLQRLLQNGGFTKCEKCSAESQQHQIECDPFQQFWDECVVMDKESQTTKGDLYERYQEWCRVNGRKPVGSSEVGKFVPKRGVTEGRETTGKRTRFWVGIKLVGDDFGDTYIPRAEVGRFGSPPYVVPVHAVRGPSGAATDGVVAGSD